MSEKFFRACPECRKFFTSRDSFLAHKCMVHEFRDPVQQTYKQQIEEMTGTEDVPKSEYIPGGDAAKRNEQLQRSELKKKYISFLKGKGIDMSTERSFRKLEEAYKSNGGE